MIVFYTDTWTWDLTNFGLTFTENSPYFSQSIKKNFSFPVTVELDENTAYKLGLVNLNGIKNYKKKIYGNIIIDNDFYKSYILINSIKGSRAEITFFYGAETLLVFDKQLKNLPWPIIEAPGGDLRAYGKILLSSQWPNTSHQFISVYRDDLSSKKKYKEFEGFVNKMVYNETIDQFVYVLNTYEDIDGEQVAFNRNVMAPMVYFLEILKVGFATENLEIRGDLVNSDFFKKILLAPQQFMEKFAITEFDNYSFTFYTSQEFLNNPTNDILNVYQKTYTPTVAGVYNINININMPTSVALSFFLKITQNGETLYESTSSFSPVNIDYNLNIPVSGSQINQDIVITLKLPQQAQSIAPYNLFRYELKEGELNVFPSTYTLADFMPEMTFREYFNRIKGWLNLDPVYTENAVYLNFLENSINNLVFKDRSHLEMVDPERLTGTNNLFVLSYPNGEQVMVNENGQIYNDNDFVDSEKQALDFEIEYLKIRQNFGKVTATYPEDMQDLMFFIYNGLVDGENLAVSNVNLQTLTLQKIFDLCWKKWLTFRANSETVKDTFIMHASEAINLKEGEYKYNTKRLLVSIRKKRLNAEYYKVEAQAETF